MILGTPTKYNVGDVVHPTILTDYHGRVIAPQPVYIVREATEQEWAQGIREAGGIVDKMPGIIHYYEVSTD